MANEITVNASLGVTNGSFVLPRYGGQFAVTQAVAGGGTPGMVSLTTSEEVISQAELTGIGYLWIKNLDATNDVIYGPESGGALVNFGRLKPGEQAVMRINPGAVIRAKSSAGTVRAMFVAIET